MENRQSAAPHRRPESRAARALWARLLGVHDDFFAPGRHSLIATRPLREAHALPELENAFG